MFQIDRQGPPSEIRKSEMEMRGHDTYFPCGGRAIARKRSDPEPPRPTAPLAPLAALGDSRDPKTESSL